jgi:hypothetical protein
VKRVLQVHDSSANAPRSNIKSELNDAKITKRELRAKSPRRSPRRLIKTQDLEAIHDGADAFDGPEVGKIQEKESKQFKAHATRRSWRDYFILSKLYHPVSLPGTISYIQADAAHINPFVNCSGNKCLLAFHLSRFPQHVPGTMSHYSTAPGKYCNE